MGKHEVAEVSITIKFTDGLVKTVEQGKASGEQVSVKSVIDSLVSIYRREIENNEVFIQPLKVLDRNVKIIVEGKVL